MFGDFWRDLSPSQKFGFVAGVIIIVGLAATLLFWSYRVEYGVLFRSLSEQDAAAVVTELDKQKIKYQLGDSGKTILVDKRKIDETRLKLSSEELSLKGGVGFELFDNVDYGMSEFSQKIYYQRALQGELSRTISAIDGVKSVRVHLVLPETSLFSEEVQHPKAAVTVVMNADKALSKAQINGIQRLVSSSVKGMEPHMVTISDGRGVLLSPAVVDPEVIGTSMLDQKQAMEAYLDQKATKLLEKVFGPGMALVSVDVSLGHDRVQTETQKILPEKSGRGVLVHQKNNSTSKSSKSAEDYQKSHPSSTTRSTEESFEVSRQNEKVVRGIGNIERLTVSVLIPDNTSEEKRLAISDLVATAVGVNSDRGDILEVRSLGLRSSDKSNFVKSDSVDGLVDTSTEPATPSPASRVEPLISSRVIGIALLVMSIVIVWTMVRSRSGSKRVLSDAERRATLRQVQQWLADDKQGAAQ